MRQRVADRGTGGGSELLGLRFRRVRAEPGEQGGGEQAGVVDRRPVAGEVAEVAAARAVAEADAVEEEAPGAERRREQAPVVARAGLVGIEQRPAGERGGDRVRRARASRRRSGSRHRSGSSSPSRAPARSAARAAGRRSPNAPPAAGEQLARQPCVGTEHVGEAGRIDLGGDAQRPAQVERRALHRLDQQPAAERRAPQRPGAAGVEALVGVGPDPVRARQPQRSSAAIVARRCSRRSAAGIVPACSTDPPTRRPAG